MAFLRMKIKTGHGANFQERGIPEKNRGSGRGGLVRAVALGVNLTKVYCIHGCEYHCHVKLIYANKKIEPMNQTAWHEAAGGDG